MALKYIGKNYAGNDAYLESEFAAPWFIAWLRHFKSDHPSIPTSWSRLMVLPERRLVFIQAAGAWTFRSGISPILRSVR